jgi:hypothetical protein
MNATQTPTVQEMKNLDKVFSPNYGGDLVVNGLSYGRVPVEDVLSGEAKPIAATLSADGRSWIAQWHEGPESDESIYVETHDRWGCRFHGYVDSVSRRIVQAG